MAPRTQVSSATLIMGATGSGKSSLARTLAEYLWETYQKVLYYYAIDGGGYPAPVQEGVALGIIKVWRLRTRDPGDLGLAFETCYRAAQGWWPRRINPATGEVEPGVELVPPVVKRYQMKCPNGHLVKTVPSQSLLTPQACPQCRTMVTAQLMQITEVSLESRGFEDRGGVFFDGLTSMLSWAMMELGQRAGRLELKGEEGAIGGKVVSGSLKFGGVTRSHVGFAQTRGEELAHLALGIPNLKVPPIFTALTMEALDEGNLTVVGPKIAGKAKTDEAPQWFGNCLEAAKVPAETGSGEQYTLFLEEFTDTDGRRHLLKHRGSPGTMPAKLADPVGGPPFSEFNLGKFFTLLDAALATGIDAAKLKYPNAPGVQDGIVEYGDGNAVQQGAAAPAPPTAAPTPGAPAAPTAQKPAAAPAPKAAQPAKPRAAAPRTQAAPAAAPAPAAAAAPQPEGGTSPAPVATPAAPAPSPAAPAAPAAAPAAARAGAAPPPGVRPGSTPAPAAKAAAPAGSAPKPPAAAPRPPAARPAAAAPATPQQK